MHGVQGQSPEPAHRGSGCRRWERKNSPLGWNPTGGGGVSLGRLPPQKSLFPIPTRDILWPPPLV